MKSLRIYGRLNMENDFNPICFYDQCGDIYDKSSHSQVNDPSSEYESSFAVLVASLNPKSILEIGCGTGRKLKALVQHYDDYKKPLPKIYGVDPSPKMLSHIPKEIMQRVNLTKTAQTDIFEDNQIDVVFTCGVLCSIQNEIAVKIIKEAFRISKCFSLHTDIPKDGPHLNDFDFLTYFFKSKSEIKYWSTMCPYPMENEDEHQIVIGKSGQPQFLDNIPLRSKQENYKKSWTELLEERVGSDARSSDEV